MNTQTLSGNECYRKLSNLFLDCEEIITARKISEMYQINSHDARTILENFITIISSGKDQVTFEVAYVLILKVSEDKNDAQRRVKMVYSKIELEEETSKLGPLIISKQPYAILPCSMKSSLEILKNQLWYTNNKILKKQLTEVDRSRSDFFAQGCDSLIRSTGIQPNTDRNIVGSSTKISENASSNATTRNTPTFFNSNNQSIVKTNKESEKNNAKKSNERKANLTSSIETCISKGKNEDENDSIKVSKKRTRHIIDDDDDDENDDDEPSKPSKMKNEKRASITSPTEADSKPAVTSNIEAFKNKTIDTIKESTNHSDKAINHSAKSSGSQGKRKVTVTKQVIRNGYMVTEEEEIWEDIVDDKQLEETKSKTMKETKKAGPSTKPKQIKKSKDGMVQQSVMSFFQKQ